MRRCASIGCASALERQFRTTKDANVRLLCKDDIEKSELPIFPITGTPPTVGDCYNLDGLVAKPVNYEIWKPPQQVAARAVQIGRTAVRARLNSSHGHIEFLKKAVCGNGASIGIPLVSGLDFIACRWVELELQSHYSELLLVKRRRTSAQGIGVTAPLSSSSNRRAISSLHAA